MNPIRLTSCVLVVLVLVALSDATFFKGFFNRRNRNGRGSDDNDENTMVCTVMSRMFTNRYCMSRLKPGMICRMLNFMITMGGYNCQQFPCYGYGSTLNSVCVRRGSCGRIPLSNGLCEDDDQCCIDDLNDDSDEYDNYDDNGFDDNGFDFDTK